MRPVFLLLLLLWAFFSAAPAGAEPRTIRLASLDWPPFSGADLPDGGATIAVARAAYAAVGVTLEVVFAPWARVMRLAQGGEEDVVGYLPEYARADAPWSRCSASIGESPLGFVERADAPVAWRRLDDLKGRPIGVVRGYANTEAFDRMAADGALITEPVRDDVTNLRKIAGGRLGLAVIDRHVMAHLLADNPDIRASALRFNANVLENKTLHVCFSKDEAGAHAFALFAEGLARIDAAALMAAHLAAPPRS